VFSVGRRSYNVRDVPWTYYLQGNEETYNNQYTIDLRFPLVYLLNIFKRSKRTFAILVPSDLLETES
jgi:hypothetical protein